MSTVDRWCVCFDAMDDEIVRSISILHSPGQSVSSFLFFLSVLPSFLSDNGELCLIIGCFFFLFFKQA